MAKPEPSTGVECLYGCALSVDKKFCMKLFIQVGMVFSENLQKFQKKLEINKTTTAYAGASDSVIQYEKFMI